MKTFGVKQAGSMSLRRTLMLVAVSAAAASFMAAPAGAQAPAPTVVMRGLDNPRGLAFARLGDGSDPRDVALYVAESGRGGNGNCITLRGQQQCEGPTGAVSRLYRGRQKRVATGLPSYAPASGAGATGPHDVSFQGGAGYVLIGLHGEPTAIRNAFGAGFGRLARLHPNGSWSYEVDVTAYEISTNPGRGPVDSNPHGLLNGAGKRFVVEAGGNALLRVGPGRRQISTVAIFPSRAQGRSTDSVTSAVAVGPDGAFYVSEITGAPFSVGAARVYRVAPGRGPEVFVEGFTSVIDIDFDERGNLYVLEHATGAGLSGPGALTRVSRNGTRTLVATGLNRPTSVAIGPDCDAYVSNNGVSAGTGEVLRFDLRCPD